MLFAEDLEATYNSMAEPGNAAPHGLFEYALADGLAYLTTENDTYNLVIFSNFLHFFPMDKIEEYMNAALHVLIIGGYIFVLMANSGHNEYAQDPSKTLMTDSLLQKLSTFGEIEETSTLAINTYAIIRKRE